MYSVKSLDNDDDDDRGGFLSWWECAGTPSRLPYSTDSYFHHFDICTCQFHDKCQTRKYEKTQQGNLRGLPPLIWSMPEINHSFLWEIVPKLENNLIRKTS